MRVVPGLSTRVPPRISAGLYAGFFSRFFRVNILRVGFLPEVLKNSINFITEIFHSSFSTDSPGIFYSCGRDFSQRFFRDFSWSSSGNCSHKFSEFFPREVFQVQFFSRFLPKFLLSFLQIIIFEATRPFHWDGKRKISSDNSQEFPYKKFR